MSADTPNETNPGSTRASRPRVSAFAVTALFLSPLLFLGGAALALYWQNAVWKQGWEGFGQLLWFGIALQVVLFGGTAAAAVSLVLAMVAMRRIGRRAQSGQALARLAVIVCVTSLVCVWGAVGSYAFAIRQREIPHRKAEEEMRGAYLTVAEHARKSGLFPDSLADVMPRDLAARYIYHGKGLSGAYADYRTANSQGIVVMHSAHTVDGMHTAVCANGMIHSWDPMILRLALRESERLRATP